MTAISANRTIVPFLVFLACGVALALAIQYGRRPAVDTGAATTAPAMSKSASEAREQSPAPLAKVEAETKSFVDALIGSPPAPESNDGIPTFDVARIEPTGETVIAAGQRRAQRWNCCATAKCMIARSRINPDNSSSSRQNFRRARMT